MCDYHVYIKKNGGEELFMETVQTVTPVEGGYRIVNLFGEEKIIPAEIHSLALLDHKIIMKEK